MFAYGSLLVEDAASGPVEHLAGHRRTWGVATDNMRAIPGYKMYLRRSDGVRPAVYVAFVDIEPDPAGTVRGIVRTVSEADLAELDLRERNYDRIEVTGAIEADFGGPVWTYRGSAEGRKRLRRGRAEGRAVISRDYLEKVAAGLTALGEHHEPDLPVWDLERIDLPADPPPAR